MAAYTSGTGSAERQSGEGLPERAVFGARYILDIVCHHVVNGRVRHLAVLNADGQIFVGREQVGTCDLPNVFSDACCRNPPQDLVETKQYAVVTGHQQRARSRPACTVSARRAQPGPRS